MFYETMTKVSRGGWTIRVWRESWQFETGPDQEVIDNIEWLYMWCRESGLEFSVERIMKRVCELPRIEAIEVLGSLGNGAIYYPDWK